MLILKRSVDFFVCGIVTFSACCAANNLSPQGPTVGQSKESTLTVSASQIREALRSPDERIFQTLLGTLVIKSSNDITRTPGKMFLNDELIYTARQDEPIEYLRGRPFSLRPISWQDNGKRDQKYGITRLVVEERSWTCQYLVLDFTGPTVWISERFPKEVFQKGQCADMTWVRWEKQLAYFYFGADYQDWEKGVYRGWVEGYNPKLKAVFGPVDAPPPPKDASLVPKRKPH